MRIVLLFSVGMLWAQDSIRATARMRGDYVEVAFEWKGASNETPLGANFVLVGSPASAIAWQLAEVTTPGRWHASASNWYHPLYLTARSAPNDSFRVSLNLLSKQPPTGEAFSGGWEGVGAWRAPVLRFGDTLHLRWGMETGEIVLAPFERAKNRFVFLMPEALWLCPSFPPLRLVEASGSLRVEGLDDFRPENLTIRWYRDGVLVHEGTSFVPTAAGAYYAEARHRCGSQAISDTLVWRVAAVAVQERYGWRLYPNPTPGTLWIEAPTSAPLSIKLWDSAGRCLFSQETHISSSNAHRLTLPSLSVGIYRLTLISDRETLTFPIVYAP